MDFPNALRTARKAARMTQEQLALAIGAGQSRIGNYEGGAREPSLDELRQIADALGVTCDALLGRSPVASQPTRLAGPILADAYRMARTAVEVTGMNDFDPEHEPEDAELLAEAIGYMLENDLTAATDSDVLRFVVMVGGKRDAGRSSGQDGSAGGSTGTEEAGSKARVARRRG